MGRKLLVASLAAVAAVWVIVFVFRWPKAIHSVDVAYFLSHDMSEQQVRVGGVLVHGSLCKVEPDCGYRFSIQQRGSLEADGTLLPPPREQLSVSYDDCIIPDTFRDLPGYDVEVRVEGERCQSCHDFAASEVIARCPGKYDLRYGPPPAPTPIPRCKAATPRM